ncbi:hypothetical protein Xen7305DRAFT_00020790 [Xenococcus sp. PCC 7305]|uniref:DUF6765 family protein n=1 Tax=Xenococcus sp. PCC 7305 TaxID=102125 RepID=UPI0002ABBCC3|nr:DUF6765 family protein [Xenococcus sp. PCC 7305]ELS02365.1 hypothetical protein Xen7305DRAFT_00020790 [Xenococcus sp. PCC 7305]
MQIDFHHSVTYVLSRLAGFDHAQANTIAHSAQYVDDATNAGLILFENGGLFSRISSAHKMLDYRNFRKLANYQVWIPFHFLPGNDGLPAGEDPEGKFIHKLICRPNSHVAQAMVTEAILNHHKSSGLYRLGITMHVYADTWAHQGFAGVNHRVNEADDLVDENGEIDSEFNQRLNKYFRKNFLEQLAGALIGDAFPLGHGAVLSNPDKPFLKWGYKDGLGRQVERDNPRDFLEAAENMYIWLQRYRLKDPTAEVSGLPTGDRELIAQMIATIRDNDSHARHEKWLASIREGKFSFGTAEVPYISKGRGSWKYEALKTEKAIDTGKERFPYNSTFLQSDWKLFHDALKAHRLYIVDELLPQFGICVA